MDPCLGTRSPASWPPFSPDAFRLDRKNLLRTRIHQAFVHGPSPQLRGISRAQTHSRPLVSRQHLDQISRSPPSLLPRLRTAKPCLLRRTFTPPPRRSRRRDLPQRQPHRATSPHSQPHRQEEARQQRVGGKWEQTSPSRSSPQQGEPMYRIAFSPSLGCRLSAAYAITSVTAQLQTAFDSRHQQSLSKPLPLLLANADSSA